MRAPHAFHAEDSEHNDHTVGRSHRAQPAPPKVEQLPHRALLHSLLIVKMETGAPNEGALTATNVEDAK